MKSDIKSQAVLRKECILVYIDREEYREQRKTQLPSAGSSHGGPTAGERSLSFDGKIETLDLQNLLGFNLFLNPYLVCPRCICILRFNVVIFAVSLRVKPLGAVHMFAFVE